MIKIAGGRFRAATHQPDSRPDPLTAKTLFVEAAHFFAEGDLVRSEKSLDRHLKIQPGSWPGLCMKALIAGRTHREALAEQLWIQLLAANPAYVDGHCQLGLLCDAQRRFAEAESHFQRALQLEPRNFTARLALGSVFQRQGQHARAIEAYQHAAAVQPGSAQPHFGMAVAWQEAGDFFQAQALFEMALALDPDYPSAHSNLLYCQHFNDRVSDEARFESAVRFGKWVERRVAVTTCRERPWEPGHPLRIGFVSGDLRQHPVGYFLESVLEALDRQDKELIAFSNSAQEDALTVRIKRQFQAWHSVDTLSDVALVETIRREKIDILIDLSGHTGGNRLPVFAARAAPVQVGWLGYFATTGLSRVDYVFADPGCVPDGEERFFTEKIWRLPETRLCFTPPRDAPPVTPLPVLAGQPFTFGCFQDLAKIGDRVLAAWVRILKARPTARIRVQSVRLGHAEVLDGFSRRLLQWGLPLDRIQLLGPTGRAEYLEAYSGIDMVLDTFPFPGGTTTVEALWMGVPTLTVSATGMLGRQGAGLLRNAGLGEWVCENVDEFVDKAVRWADTSAETGTKLAALRSGLRAQVQASPLVDAPRFARHFDDALRQIWRERCACPDGNSRDNQGFGDNK